ncbi:MAG: hypothetical protein M1819_006624 [Sarea resinae]|nr:MAG: hypothetical protein M1819_006624 [Sarea resinae]
MSYYQNGQNYYGHRNAVQPPPPPPPQAQNHSIARSTSFDAGDDAALTESNQSNSGLGLNRYGRSEDMANGAYRAGANVGAAQNEDMYMGALPPRPSQTAQSSPYQYQPQSPVAPYQGYNPQQFQRSQTQSYQTYSGANSQYGSVHQPYNPAAYQAPNVQRHSSSPAQPYGFSPSSHSSSTFSHPSPGQPAYAPPTPSAQHPPQSPYWDPGRQSQHPTPPTQYSPYAAQVPPQPTSTSIPQQSSGYSAPPRLPPRPPLESLPSDEYYSVQAQDTYRPETGRNSYSPRFESTHPSQRRLPSPPRYVDSSTPAPFSTLRRPSTSSTHMAESPLPPTPGPPPPQHSPQRTDTLTRHPQSRPLPGPPPEDSDADYFRNVNGNGVGEQQNASPELTQDDIWREVEAAVMRTGSDSRSQRLSPRVESSRRSTIDEQQEPQPLFAGASHESGLNNGGHVNGQISATGSGQYVNYAPYSDESDAEAAAGLAAMNMADQQDLADQARGMGGGMFRGYGPGQHSDDQGPAEQDLEEPDSDSAYGVDIDLYGGGYGGAHLHYGDDVGHKIHEDQGAAESTSRPLPTPGSGADSGDDYGYDYPLDYQDTMLPYAPVKVDAFGTGGLSEPTAGRRRLSFDEGDEVTLAESDMGDQVTLAESDITGMSSMGSATKEDMPDLFYHPGPSQRSLPQAPDQAVLMPGGPYQRFPEFQQPPPTDRHFLSAAANRDQTTSPGPLGPRSTSLSSHSSTPQMIPPIRSKTDAEERRVRLLKQQLEYRLENADTPVTSSITLDLPAIPLGRMLNPAKLSNSDFKKCTEPWALSSIAAWVKEMSEGSTDLKKHTIVDGIVALFTHKVPTMNTADAETLGARVVKDMFEAGALIKEEEWVKLGVTTEMTGVIFQLTGSGCYSPKSHSQTMAGRCYAPHCQRTLKKINLQAQLLEPQRKLEDWITFYKFKKEDLEGVHKKEIERQNILHEIVQTEDIFMDQLDVLRLLYRDQLRKTNPPVLAPKRIDKFATEVFGKVDAVKKANEEYLLPQLKYRQQEQGPWIVGFSDIFREWIRKAKVAYIEYAANFPNATFVVRKEAERNIQFRNFLDQMRDNARSKRLGWDTYLKAPITRLQRYSLLLATVHKNMLQDTEEKANLKIAIDEIKAVTMECDARVAEMSKKVDLADLNSKLVLRPGMERVELNLNHLGRELIFKGDLQRLSSNRFNWLETHALLFDHYAVFAKTVSQRDAAGGVKYERYDVSKLPIPMDLLVLESTNDDTVVKSAVKGIGAVTTVAPKVSGTIENRLGRMATNTPPADGSLTLTSTNTSSASNGTPNANRIVTNTVLEGSKDDKILYPFRVKHLGKAEVYTLYAPTAQNRRDWCDKIIEAKTRHAASLFAQNAEPFRLRVIADTAFGYDTMSGGSKSISIRGTPLDRAIREVESNFKTVGPRPGPVCRAAVNCATAFNQPPGNPMVAVGTDYGVFISEADNPRGWRKATNTPPRVTQIAVLEEFGLMLLIADKSLIAYHLDAVCPVNGAAPANDSIRRAPQKLSGTRDVGFFATSTMKDRTLVFYKKREGLSSTFKVLEPVFQKSTPKTSRFLLSSAALRNRGTTEYFRTYDEFYIPSDCFSLNLFHSSLAVATARGFEVLTLDKKQPFSVPDLKAPHVVTIANRLAGQKPLGMFRLGEEGDGSMRGDGGGGQAQEFLLCYEECGVYVNRHGDVSRSVIMEFVGRARAACMVRGFLVLFDHEFVEVRNAVNGRLRQVVQGRDVRLLDDGGARGGAVKVCMQHPEFERCQIVFELVLNEGTKE